MKDVNNSTTSKVLLYDEKVSAKRIMFFGIKRIFDIFMSLIGIILLIPTTLIIKICYLLTGDTKSIIYSHERIGKNGKPFKLYKFRSMVVDADDIFKDMMKNKKLKKEWENNQKFGNDKRLTKIGKLLRKASIDEMPQFINVLRGDMSFIGPRPLVKDELVKHNGISEIYESVKPGITGWWACNGRSETTYEKRLELEYYYVNNIGFKIDILCFFKTISSVFFKRGAK